MQSVLNIVRKLFTERYLHLQCRTIVTGDLCPNSSNTVRCTSNSSTSPIENFKDTIYAVSSGRGKCGVAVVRISGSQTKNIMMRMGSLTSPPKPRQALLRTLVDPKSKDKLDTGLVLWFPGPESFTGEDCCELQVHGGVAVLSAILSTLNRFPQTRHAEAGEFTKRSFINGKLDLTKVEGLADVIHAETEVQRRQAFRQMSGELSYLYQNWRRDLVKSMANVEAYIDFSEEENIEDDVLGEVRRSLLTLSADMQRHLSDGRKGERLRDGVHVAILGKPNVGKSSLINYLSRRDVAIVSPIEGTTRDTVEATLDINGYPVVLVDTAGLRTSDDLIEQEGVRRAVSRSQEADLLIIMLSCEDLDGKIDYMRAAVETKVIELLKQHIQLGDDSTSRSMMVLVNKVDLINQSDSSTQTSSSTSYDSNTTIHGIHRPTGDTKVDSLNPIDSLSTKDKMQGGNIQLIEIQGEKIPIVFTSLTRDTGTGRLLQTLTNSVKELCADPSNETISYTKERHRNHLSNCVEYVGQALDTLDSDVVMTAENLRLASVEIGQVTGVISSEEVLDVLFRDFCIGK